MRIKGLGFRSQKFLGLGLRRLDTKSRLLPRIELE